MRLFTIAPLILLGSTSWYYKPSSGSLPMLVTIVDGKIKTIERTE